MKKDWNVVVVGAGVFGLTTALELALQGYRNVTVLDRHVPPVRLKKESLHSIPDSANIGIASNRSLTAPAWISHVSSDLTTPTRST